MTISSSYTPRYGVPGVIAGGVQPGKIVFIHSVINGVRGPDAVSHESGYRIGFTQHRIVQAQARMAFQQRGARPLNVKVPG
ncbi:hypothetical protein [Xenorhabdus vietnamensis]|uniref:hypothetical protein n=1 Tax=Xenorhabdus TaxID=626 RepID=UPI001ABFB1FA|nr:hypothetical protein [Xenorhabdus vietnamensis]